jgi:hypothetical protein
MALLSPKMTSATANGIAAISSTSILKLLFARLASMLTIYLSSGNMASLLAKPPSTNAIGITATKAFF